MKNLNPIGFITVRSCSSRLPGKCFLPFGDRETVLSHVIKRSISYNIEPIVCTSTHPSDNAIEDTAIDLGVKVFRGSLNNKLKRWLDCARFFQINYFHTIDADDPFFDGDEMIRSIQLLNKKKIDIVFPSKSSSSGGASEGYSLTTNIVERALENIEEDTDTEMMWYFIEKVNGLTKETLSDKYSTPIDVRLTLDYKEDYWMLASLVNILGNKVSRNDINKFLVNNPDFTKINFFRNKEWKNAQLEKKI